MFEKEVQRQLYAFLTKHELLHPCQHGFRVRRSTHTALLTVVDKWLQCMDNSQVSAVVFLDLAKAFNTVRHPLPLKKLSTLGISGTELDWFSSYLTNHQQRVVYNGTLSTDQPTTCGVPQGSFLGPLLFLMYVNTVPECIKYGDINMFADDAALFFTSKDHSKIGQKLNIDLKLISEWLEVNGLVINPTKTEFILMGTISKAQIPPAYSALPR